MMNDKILDVNIKCPQCNKIGMISSHPTTKERKQCYYCGHKFTNPRCGWCGALMRNKGDVCDPMCDPQNQAMYEQELK